GEQTELIMVRAITCWSFVGVVLAGMFYAGSLLAGSEGAKQEADLPPILQRMPAYPGEPLEFADEAMRQEFESRQIRPHHAVAESEGRRQENAATTIYMSYSPAT